MSIVQECKGSNAIGRFEKTELKLQFCRDGTELSEPPATTVAPPAKPSISAVTSISGENSPFPVITFCRCIHLSCVLGFPCKYQSQSRFINLTIHVFWMCLFWAVASSLRHQNGSHIQPDLYDSTSIPHHFKNLYNLWCWFWSYFTLEPHLGIFVACIELDIIFWFNIS